MMGTVASVIVAIEIIGLIGVGVWWFFFKDSSPTATAAQPTTGKFAFTKPDGPGYQGGGGGDEATNYWKDIDGNIHYKKDDPLGWLPSFQVGKAIPIQSNTSKSSSVAVNPDMAAKYANDPVYQDQYNLLNN